MIRERSERPAAQEAERPAVPAAIAPINWWRLDPEERTETLTTLAVFVPELVRRYALSDQILPPCWYRHEPLVQELLALYQYRNQNQFLPTAPPVAPKEFHFELQQVIARLRSWVAQTGCNIAEHNEDRVQSWALPGGSAGALWQTEVEDFINEGAPAAWGARNAGGALAARPKVDTDA